MDALTARLNELCDEVPFEIGWYVKDLGSGWSAERRGDVIVPSASVRKVAILAAALRAVHQGRIDLDQRVPVDTDLDTTSGCFQWFAPGLEVAIRDLLLMMIVVSDNVSTRHVTGLVGLDAVQALCDSVGMKGTAHRRATPDYSGPRNPRPGVGNDTTPVDQGILLQAILDGASSAAAAARIGITPELCTLALDILSKQRLKNRIPYWLPERTKVAHKTGTLGGNVGDVGIVFRDNEPLFILCALTDGVPVELPDGASGHAAADHLIGQLARVTWDALAARATGEGRAAS